MIDSRVMKVCNYPYKLGIKKTLSYLKNNEKLYSTEKKIVLLKVESRKEVQLKNVIFLF